MEGQTDVGLDLDEVNSYEKTLNSLEGPFNVRTVETLAFSHRMLFYGCSEGTKSRFSRVFLEGSKAKTFPREINRFRSIFKRKILSMVPRKWKDILNMKMFVQALNPNRPQFRKVCHFASDILN